MSEYNKLLGQHFIYDEEILIKIANAATRIKDKHILEIGPGVGTLTKTILSQEPSLLTAIEKDKRFAQKHALLEMQYENYKYIIGDALFVPLRDLYKGEKITIIANLPYNIATRLLLNWLEESEYIQEMVLMFQKEVVDRICAQPRNKNYGALSVLMQVKCTLEPQFTLPPEVFTPPPKVTSSVLKLTPITEQKLPYRKITLEKILVQGFSQRRKIMNKSLSGVFKSNEELCSALEEIGAHPGMRIEELTPKQLCRLSFLVDKH